MGHIKDKETGLCIVCDRLKIAAYNEGKKYRRQSYDIRQIALDRKELKSDPNYRTIIDRHKIDYKTSLNDNNKNTSPRGTNFITKQRISQNISKSDVEKVLHTDTSDQRYNLKKINLANAYRINNLESNNNKSSIKNYHDYIKRENGTHAEFNNNSNENSLLNQNNTNIYLKPQASYNYYNKDLIDGNLFIFSYLNLIF
jgi:hypothetical protein